MSKTANGNKNMSIWLFSILRWFYWAEFHCMEGNIWTCTFYKLVVCLWAFPRGELGSRSFNIGGYLWGDCFLKSQRLWRVIFPIVSKTACKRENQVLFLRYRLFVFWISLLLSILCQVTVSTLSFFRVKGLHSMKPMLNGSHIIGRYYFWDINSFEYL